MFYVNKEKKDIFKESKCGLLCEPHRIINKKGKRYKHVVYV